MRMYDIIHKKRLGDTLSKEEIDQLIRAYVAGEIPDYQMSALAMAIVFQGMSDQEITDLTLAMAHSGHTLNWTDIPGRKVDKHSTGGVGDTTTLVLGPLVTSLGIPIVKMSGRGLGHTGGTIDKLESIPGFTCSISMEQFRNQVRNIGIAIAAQTTDLAPADRKLYALRDVTDTVESIPLIASSIMSKKLASGADAIVLDVKVGDGAFMKNLDAARKLARAMVSIGHRSGRDTVAVLTDMGEPLGRAIGNALEVREAIMTLRGQGPEDLTELCLVLGAEMVVEGGKATTVEEARGLLLRALEDGSAIAKWKEFVQAQGGDPRVADDLSLLPKAEVVRYFTAPSDGVVAELQAEAIGLVAMRLGAGRARHEDVIRPEVGLVLQRKVGQRVVRGEPLVEVHAASDEEANQAIRELASCIHIRQGEPFTPKLVLDVVRAGADGTPRPQSSVPGQGAGRHRIEKQDQNAETDHAQDNPTDGGHIHDQVIELVEHAKRARETAYVPYSTFKVGAALRLSNGEIAVGANVENASYGLTNCAERTAIFSAVTAHDVPRGVSIQEIAVIADSEGPVAPCGACRQVLAEFCGPQTPVALADIRGNVKLTTVGELIPYAFGAAQMPQNVL